MEIKFNVTGADRKQLVGIISEVTGWKAVYKGMPSAAYGERETLLLLAIRLLVAIGDTHRYSENVIRAKCCASGFTAEGKAVLG